MRNNKTEKYISGTKISKNSNETKMKIKMKKNTLNILNPYQYLNAKTGNKKKKVET